MKRYRDVLLEYRPAELNIASLALGQVTRDKTRERVRAYLGSWHLLSSSQRLLSRPHVGVLDLKSNPLCIYATDDNHGVTYSEPHIGSQYRGCYIPSTTTKYIDCETMSQR
jgi:hypothetical protein